MNVAIKNRFTGEIIVEADKYSNIRDAVEKSGANLSEANLSGSNLYSANLFGAKLSGANLFGANLSGANGEKLTLLKETSILIIGPIGSRCSYLTAYNSDHGIYIKTGCYFGKIDDFKSAVDRTHSGTKHAHDYMSVIAFIKSVMIQPSY